MPALPPEETRSTPVGSNAAGGAIVRKWMDLHDQVTQLARIADLGAEGAIFDPVPFAEQLERASERQRNLAWQAIEDIDAMLQPGLTALHTITARGQNASAPALALWRELHAAREGLLAILACNTPGETRDAA